MSASPKADTTLTGGTSRGVLLIADDEEIVRSGLEALLRREGFTCVAVASGAEALAALQKQEFDAMISDIHMPGNAQLETVATIRRIAPALPIVLLTGQPSVETAARSVRLPVTAYLTKPPDMGELVRILDEAIADFRTYRALQAGRTRLHTWTEELEEIEHGLRAAPAGGAAQSVTMGAFLRANLRQVILMLSDLERATGVLEHGASTPAAEHEAALRHTVEVLERTKQSFKSKELAELRRGLEELLARTGKER
ncbi:MAG: response regulator [Verrucomicrobiota bacterium]